MAGKWTYEGKSAIVTGGAGGIGKGIVGALVREGARVWIADINEALAQQTAEEFRRAGADVEAHAMDVTDRPAVEDLVERAWDHFGGLDMLFNNAGVAHFGDLLDMDDSAWQRTVDINIMGVIHGVRAAYPRMAKAGRGKIVNTASVAGLGPTPGLAIYSLSKHAVVGLSRSLYIEAEQYGVGVHVVCPGLVDTPMVDNAAYENLQREELQKGPIERLPFATPEQVGKDVLKGVRKNKEVIITPRSAAIFTRLTRGLPRIERAVGRLLIRTLRDHRKS